MTSPAFWTPPVSIRLRVPSGSFTRRNLARVPYAPPTTGAHRITGLAIDALAHYPDDLAMSDLESVRSLGRRVRALRLQKGWTQEQLADKADLNLVQISRIERGVREVRFTTLLSLLAALEVKPDELLGDL